ncbi:MAG: 2-hydroxychromene-2-carboxylate isomerase [Rubrivivax sp.]|nr:2-hydroxychromene-2-carboxylate isomerase [Rubrivivax sp.]
MKRLVFWFDVVSPFAYLAFERLPQVLQGQSWEVEYRPLLFAGLLKHWGQKGPAEVEPKRAWTFRLVHWQEARDGIELQTPALHPFNPLPLLRLAWACAPEGGTPNRRVVEALFRHVWQGGADAGDPGRLAALSAALAPLRDPQSDTVKQALRASTDAAQQRGIFGVPTIELDGRLFWGLDSLEMVAAALAGNALFDGPDWDREGAPRPGLQR